MEVERATRRIREELLGRHFSNQIELRHMAEGAGCNFVPAKPLSTGTTLRRGLGEIRVQVVRPVPWQPLFIVEVNPA